MQDMMGEQAAPEQAPEVQEAPQEDTPPAPKWTFAGEEFPDQTAAENKYKTVKGMIKASEARTRQALELVQQYEAEVERLRQGAPQQVQPEQQGQPQQEAQRFVEALGPEGWNTYESMRTERGESFANAWLMDKVEDHVRSMVDYTAQQLREELSNRFPLLEEQNAHLETIQNVSALFQEFQQLPNDAEDGPRYPALHERDPKKLEDNVRKIGRIWKRFVERADPQTIRDPYWMDVAYSEFERANGNPGSGGGGPDNLDRLQRAAQERSSGAVSGNGAPMRERSPRDGQKDIARLFTTTPQRKTWGFDPDR